MVRSANDAPMPRFAPRHLRPIVRAVVLAAVALIAGTTNTARAQSAAPLAFVLEATRASYAAGGPVVVVLRLESTAPVTANARLAVGAEGSPLQEVSIVVENAQRRALPFRLAVQSRPPRDDDFTDVTPTQPVERRYDLARAFDLRTPGVYRVRATYRNAAVGPSGRSAFTGSMRSSEITITVATP